MVRHYAAGVFAVPLRTQAVEEVSGRISGPLSGLLCYHGRHRATITGRGPNRAPPGTNCQAIYKENEMGLQEEIDKTRAEIRSDGYLISIGEWMSLYEKE